MTDIVRGIRTLDYVLAAVLTALGVFLMIVNIEGGDDPSLIHPVSTRSWWIVPVFVLATLPILWRRRNVLAVVAVTAAATVVHVLAFDWLTRCGALLPVSVALAYAVARFAGGVRNQVLGMTGVVVIQAVLLLRDCSTDFLGGLSVGLPAAAVVYAIGLLVQNRVVGRQRTVSPVAVREAA